jgi:hypothetical protein
MASRRREPPRVEDSWRLVEGENDSFDTSILPSVSDDDPFAPISSQQASSGFPSQLSSQGHLSLGSQDSIRDFSRHQDDDHVILREPFRPSLAGARTSSASKIRSDDAYRTPDPEFRMPMMDIDGRRIMAAASPSKRSQAKTRAGASSGVARAGNDARPRTRRGGLRRGNDRRRQDEYYDDGNDSADDGGDYPDGPTGLHERLAASLPAIVRDIILWALGIVALAFRYAQRPLALLLAVYLSFGAAIIAQNMITKSILVSVSPICRLPGVSMLHLPFCPDDQPPSAFFPNGTAHQRPVEFDDLMGVQGQFEQVLERSAEGVSLPMEMKRSETSIRDLRTLIRNSDVQARDELVFEFDGYIDTARQTAADLQRFNSHCGSAVDAVVAINRWTSRYIDSLAPGADGSAGGSGDDGDGSLVSLWTSWLFYPFQPAERAFNERVILDKYIEHTALVSDRIATLILEAQAVLRLLTKAEDHLSLIYDISSRSSASTANRRDQVFWNLWTLVGANNARLHNLSQQLALLRQVDAQRSTAVAQVSALVLELEAIQAGLGDLRDRVAEPELVREGVAASAAPIPLSVHIETIDRGVERLEAARRRIRAAEDDRIREALVRGGMREEHLLEGR